MGKYGDAAVKAVNLIQNNDLQNSDPREAWDLVTKEIFGGGTPSQVKGCPRNTFLGLCEAGRVDGIPAGTYTRSQKNKEYALTAIRLIEGNPMLLRDQKTLWEQTIGDDIKVHNSQMDIVVSLWNKQMIKR